MFRVWMYRLFLALAAILAVLQPNAAIKTLLLVFLIVMIMKERKTLVSLAEALRARVRKPAPPPAEEPADTPEEAAKELMIRAVHEAGHVIAAWFDPDGPRVLKVSIEAAASDEFGGFTLYRNSSYPTERQCRSHIAVSLGGRAAEKLRFGEISAGSSSDLERATEAADRMVKSLGMSAALGLRSYETDGSDYGDPTAELINKEIKHIIWSCWCRAEKIVGERRAQLDSVVETLLIKREIGEKDLEALLGPKAQE